MKTIYTAEQLKSVYGEPQIQQTTAEQPREGILKSIAKDVAGTLVVNPVTRATEAVTRLAFPESQAAKGFEMLQEEGQGQNVLGVNVPSLTGGARQITGEALKTASYLFPYGKTAGLAGKALGKIGGNVVSGATGGYLADVGFGLTDKEQTVGQALTPGLGTAIGGAVPLVGPTIRGTGRALEKLGAKSVELALPTSTREAGILQSYKANKPFLERVSSVLSGTEKAPQTAAKTALTTKAGQKVPGLFGTKTQIGIQAKRASQSLWDDIINPALKTSDQAVDLDGFFAKVQDDIVRQNPELNRQKVLLEALEAVKDDYRGIKAIDLSQLQKFKEGWAKFVPEKVYNGKPIAGAFNDVRNQLANEARQTIYSQLGDDIKQAYFDYGNLQGLQEMGKVAMTGQKLKGGAGSFVSELFSQAVTPVATIGGQAIYRIGKGIEFIGNLGAKNLGEAIGISGAKLKFPGDAAIDDISKSIKEVKSLPNKQGGFVRLLGQENSLPKATNPNQTNNIIPKTSSISKSSTKTASKSSTLPQTTVELQKSASKTARAVDDAIAGNIDELIEESTKISKKGKIDLDLMQELEDLQQAVVKGKLTPSQRLSFNEIAKKLGREDLIPQIERSMKVLKPSLKGKGVIPETKIDERLAPLVDKDGMVTVYRASAKFPETLPKDTYVSTKPDSIRYYAESWYKGNPKDIKVKSFKIPASQLKRGGNADNWQLTEEFSWKNNSKASPETNLINEAKKYKSAEEFVKAQTGGKFGNIKKIDINNPKEQAYISDFADNFMTQKSQASGLTYFTLDKMGFLNTALKQKGFKGVSASADFKGIYSLDKVIDNPALFEKYPDLRKVNVIFADFHTPTQRGVHIGNDIFLNSKLYAKDTTNIESTLVHEIEHSIQDLEKELPKFSQFEQGRSMSASEYATDLREEGARKKQQEYLDIVKTKSQLEEIWKKANKK